MASIDFDDVTTDDAQALLAAAESDWSRPVPHCPDWDLAELVSHLGGIFAWMAKIVTTGQPVARADREPPPTGLEERRAWYLTHLEATLDVLSRSSPTATVWTFSSRGVQTVGWWRRRLAVETAIHRWDAEYAIGLDAAATRALDGEVGTAGIEEFLDEFLPGLLASPTINGLNGTLHLEASDSGRRFEIDLDALRDRSTDPVAPKAVATIRATRSDLLLWLTNRAPSPSLEVADPVGTATHWRQLRR